MSLRLLMASVGVCIWAWAYFVVEGQVFVVSKQMNCVPYEKKNLQPARSRIHCSAMCLRLQCLAFMFSDGVCDLRDLGHADPAETRVFTKFIIPTLSALQEMSQGKPVASTPPLSSAYNPQYAIDGDNSTMYHSANKVTHPWWMIDLQATVYVFSVDTITRQGGFEYRFHNIEVRVGFTPPSDEDFSSWLLLGFYQGPYSYDQGTITFSNSAGLCGRYVVVQRVSSDFDQLQLAEVQVFAKSIL